LVCSVGCPYGRVAWEWGQETACPGPRKQRGEWFQVQILTGHQWFMPVILATQEVKIRRIMVRSQPGQIVLKTLS
jgi:hypothetical protein